jgi:hypothetical protein
MVAEILTGLTLFKGMLDTAKGLKDINDASVRASVAIDLQNKILEAQAQQTALTTRIDSLERQIADFERWNQESARYALRDFGSGTFAYVLKQDKADGEPDHFLCSTCFQMNRKAILQFLHNNYLRQTVYHCPVCKSDLALGTPREPPESGYQSGGWSA